MADDKTKLKAAADAGGSHLDKLLKGLDALDAKLDSMGTRMDAFEAKFGKAAKDADAPPPPPPGDKKPGEGEPEPIAADRGKKPPPPKMDAEPAVDPAKQPEPPKLDAEPPPPPGGGAKEPPPPPPPPGAAADDARFVALQKQFDELSKRVPLAGVRIEHDLAPNQHAADSVFQLWGEHAPRPLMGDTAVSYDLRQMEHFKKHAPAWKAVDLQVMSVDPAAFQTVRDQIYAAAKAAARDPVNVPAGRLRPIQTRRETGHLETRFMGSPKVWMNRHAPTGRYVSAINLKKD